MDAAFKDKWVRAHEAAFQGVRGGEPSTVVIVTNGTEAEGMGTPVYQASAYGKVAVYLDGVTFLIDHRDHRVEILPSQQVKVPKTALTPLTDQQKQFWDADFGGQYTAS